MDLARKFRTSRMSIVVLCTLAVLCSVHGGPVAPRGEEFTLSIVHTNDMHARFEETSRLSAACTPKDSKAGRCYGGFARIATLVRQARKSKEPVLFLNAGDTYQGTVWYSVYKWKIVSKFLNLLKPDAISLGNHEFDDGVDGLVPFIQNASYPIVTSNLDLSQQPNLRDTKLLNSTILLVGDQKIGVIGYLTPETKTIAITENVVFLDEVECVRREAKALKAQGVEILIAVGHSGFETDKKIAEEVEDIDIVIGGHTNTFLYSGKQPDKEIPEGLYPTEVVQKNGRKTYVVQAYAYTKYLGNFSVTFDSVGEVKRIDGNPILVDGSIEQAKDILEELDKMRGAVEEISSQEVGRTRVLLDGDAKSCRRQECNLGNIIADSIIDYYVGQYGKKNGWTDTAIAVQHSGSIRNSITRDNNDKVTMGDILNALPFDNIILKVSMTGEMILTVLEWSVHKLERNSTANLYGGFLQFSGLQVTYDLSKPSNSRVVSVKVRCAACKIPSYSDLVKNETYNVFINDFLQDGGDGYSMLKNLKYHAEGFTTADALVAYLKKHSPVHHGVEWRINYVEEQKEDENVESTTEHTEEDQNNNSGSTSRSFGAIILLPLIGLLFVR